MGPVRCAADTAAVSDARVFFFSKVGSFVGMVLG